MENQTANTRTNPVSAYRTVGDLRKQYGDSFAEGYEDTDPMTAVLGRAGTPTLGEYLSLHGPAQSQ